MLTCLGDEASAPRMLSGGDGVLSLIAAKLDEALGPGWEEVAGAGASSGDDDLGVGEEASESVPADVDVTVENGLDALSADWNDLVREGCSMGAWIRIDRKGTFCASTSTSPGFARRPREPEDETEAGGGDLVLP